MRKLATIKNSIAGLVNRIVTLVLVFLVRHYFTRYLDVDYLGLEGFFQNILGLFSLVDLGLGTAIAFDLYEPIYKRQRSQLSSIMRLYRRLYYLIGVVIFAMSVLFTPFLLHFIHGYSIDGERIKLYFLIYAFGVSVSYFFSYQRTLLFALQKNHLVTNVDTVTKVVASLLQIVVLIEYQSYFLYLILIVFTNVLANIVISVLTEKGDYYDKRHVEPISKEYRIKLTDHVKAIAVTNIAWQGVSSTDNIIISAMIGIIDLAKNANYSTIVQAITSIVTSVLGGASASVGDMLAEGNRKRIAAYFERYSFIYMVVASYAALGVFFVSEPVIRLWVGGQYVFEQLPVLLVSINLFLALIFKPMVDYQNFSGSFVYYKPYSVVALLLNLVVSLIGAKRIGISGVFLGTTATYIFMNCVVLHIVCKHVLKNAPVFYYKKFLYYSLPAVFSALILSGLFTYLSVQNLILELAMKCILVTGIYLLSVFFCLRKDENFLFFQNLVISILRRRIE